MVEVNIRTWADWDQCIKYIKEMQKEGFKIKLVNVSEMFSIWHKEELRELGFNKFTY